MADNLSEAETARRSLANTKFIQVYPGFEVNQLSGFDLFKKVGLQGTQYYVLFHKKDAPLSREISCPLYVKQQDMEHLLKTPVAATARTAVKIKPVGSIARLLITNQYETKILNNPDLDLKEKIELTVHCSGQVMKNIFGSPKLSVADFDTISTVSYNFLIFTESILQESQAVNTLLNELIGRSYETYAHSIHVSLYAGILARELDHCNLQVIGPDELNDLYLGMLLHDIGKMLIDPSILNKNAPLDEKEFEVMKKHPMDGIEIIVQTRAKISENALQVILQHHEKWSGGGYPQGISYQNITPFARIASICDVFDAMTTHRSFRPALKPFEALIIMKRQMIGKFYHPYLDSFIKVLGNISR